MLAAFKVLLICSLEIVDVWKITAQRFSQNSPTHVGLRVSEVQGMVWYLHRLANLYFVPKPKREHWSKSPHLFLQEPKWIACWSGKTMDNGEMVKCGTHTCWRVPAWGEHPFERQKKKERKILLKKYRKQILVVTLLQCLSHNLSPNHTRESEEERLLIDSLSGPSVDFIPDSSVIYRDRQRLSLTACSAFWNTLTVTSPATLRSGTHAENAGYVITLNVTLSEHTRLKLELLMFLGDLKWIWKISTTCAWEENNSNKESGCCVLVVRHFYLGLCINP